MKGDGLIKKYSEALNESTIEECLRKMFKALDNAKKAEFSLNLLFIDDTKKIKTPTYYFRRSKMAFRNIREKQQ